jgi:coenzyme F420-reducing hydrogenase beta subunit
VIDKIKKELCTGCNACFNICPEICIVMSVDEIGFRYPKVDYDKCIECKKCTNTCPSLNKLKLSGQWKEPQIYAAWSLDEEIRFTSTSGGVFSELAKAVIKYEGLVVGAVYNKQHMVEHYMTDNIEEIERLKQSKYVQSEIGDIFKHIKKELDIDKLVAFCGSPCQVAGLLNYLKKPYDNLITFDFVCRGTNSPKAYTKYMEMLENKYKSKIVKIWFKNKTYGWNRFSTRIDFENGKTYIKDRYHDLYMRGYIEENLYMRPCCFDCKYKAFPRVADITFADFWGVGGNDPKLDPDKGTSLIMINSAKGAKLFDKIGHSIFKKQSKLEVALPGNACIVKSAVENPKTRDFLMMLDDYPFDVCFKKYAKNKGYTRVRSSIRRMLSRIKKKLKSIIK